VAVANLSASDGHNSAPVTKQLADQSRSYIDSSMHTPHSSEERVSTKYLIVICE